MEVNNQVNSAKKVTGQLNEAKWRTAALVALFGGLHGWARMGATYHIVTLRRANVIK